MPTMADGTTHTPSKPIAIRPTGMKIETPVQPRFESVKAASAAAGVMSPVNQNGCFEFDRILKAGTVVKRTRKTKSWKPVYIVLRPNCLSLYKDKNETKLRHQINLAEITAVARQRDSKKKMDHVFGVFSPARNYHLGASSDKEAQEWVDLIRTEARINEEEGEITVMSPTGKKTFSGFDRTRQHVVNPNLASSSSDLETRPTSSVAHEGMHSARRPSAALNYSGNERASVSDLDFSDTGGVPGSTTSLSLQQKIQQQQNNVSQQSKIESIPDEDRVVSHGWLYVLKSKGGVRQWRRMWVVLRPKGLAFYKSEEEYSATLILPFSSIIDAVDIENVSRSKQHCMQVISEEKNIRCCAPDENALAKWLGAFKSLLNKRSQMQQARAQPQSQSQPSQLVTKPIKPLSRSSTTHSATQLPTTHEISVAR